MDIQQKEYDLRKLDTEYNTLQTKNRTLDDNIKQASKSRSKALANNKELRREINSGTKEFKKMERDNEYNKGEIEKAASELRGTVKAVEDLDKKLKKLEESKESLNEEHQLLIASLVKKGLEEKNMENKIRQLGQQITEFNDRARH